MTAAGGAQPPPPAAPCVALVAHRFADPRPTGIGRYYRELACALAERSDRPDVTLASPAEGAEPAWLPAALAHRSLGSNRSALLLSWALAGRPAADRRLGYPDLVHLLHPWAPVPTRAPQVVTLHDLMPLLHPEWFGRKARWAGRRGLLAMAADATRILPVSQFVASLATAHLGVAPERIEVVHEGIGEQFFDPPDPTSPVAAAVLARHGVTAGRYLVAVGQISTRKNLLPVLRALATLDPLTGGGSPLELLLVGSDGIGAQRVHAATADLGLAGRVRAAGFVGDAELPALLAGAAALVHPSLDEGFGFPPLEAMAAGTPALAANAGSLPEVVGSAGVLVDAQDADDWAAAITTVLTDGDHRTRLRAAGRGHADQFHWADTAEHVAAVYRALMAGGTA